MRSRRRIICDKSQLRTPLAITGGHGTATTRLSRDQCPWRPVCACETPEREPGGISTGHGCRVLVCPEKRIAVHGEILSVALDVQRLGQEQIDRICWKAGGGTVELVSATGRAAHRDSQWYRLTLRPGSCVGGNGCAQSPPLRGRAGVIPASWMRHSVPCKEHPIVIQLGE